MIRARLSRYTDLAALIYLLSNKSLTLLDPSSWDDSNDSHYLEQYKDKSGFRSVLALCFTESPERYHYWRVFANASSGARVQFERFELLKAVEREQSLTARSVRYLTRKELCASEPALKDLPFLKRRAFKDEREFRLVLTSDEALQTFNISIPLTCIAAVTLSPWLPRALFHDVRAAIRSIPGCEGLRVSHSTLIGNDEWKNFADQAPASWRARNQSGVKFKGLTKRRPS